jgi:hypothetical protein
MQTAYFSDMRTRDRAALELYLGIILTLLQWVLPMNAKLRFIIWLAILGLALDITWRSKVTSGWHPALRWVGMLVISCVVAWGWLAGREKPAPLITVQPEGKFLLHSGEWSNKTTFLVTNHGTKPLYSVAVKIWTETPGVTSEQIRVAVDNNPTAPPARFDKYEVFTDVWVIDYRDKLKREAVLMSFYELLPNKPRRILVYGKMSQRAEGFVSLLEFLDSPEPIFEQRKKVRLQVPIPEGGIPKAMRVSPEFIKDRR